jgi:autotransporter-associated beta strand protein
LGNTIISTTGITTGSGTLTKDNIGTLTLSAANTYSGATTVNAGTLLVNGALGNSAVTINGGAFGGSGTIGSTLNLLGGSFHVVDLLDALQVTGTVNLYAGFGIDDLAGLSWGSVANDTYTLINGTLGAGVFAGLNNNSLLTAYDIGGGRSAYFKEGSLQLVVIPEPATAVLGSIGLLMLLRRRRA